MLLYNKVKMAKGTIDIVDGGDSGGGSGDSGAGCDGGGYGGSDNIIS